MSYLSKFESALSYIGFMVGAPSISSPLDAQPVRPAPDATLMAGAAADRAVDVPSIGLPLSNGQEEKFGFGNGERMSATPPPGSGQLDRFGDFA